MVSLVTQGRPAFMLRGALMVLFGLAALAVPGVTAQVALVAFGALLLVAGLVTTAMALQTLQLRDGSWWPAAEGVLMAAIGLAAVLVPGAAAVAVVLLFGLWALASGLLQLVAALRLHQEARDTAGMLISAALSIALVAVFVWRPDAAANAIVWLLGAFALASGVLAIYLATKAGALRRRGAA
jgi:uncharacterized membrane protein HdeD (DUF308 family)